MAKDKGIEGQPVKALAQESLAGVERMRPAEGEFKSFQGIENLRPQQSQIPSNQSPPQAQANAQDGRVSTDNDKSSK